MAVTNKWYGNAFKAAFNKEIDFNSDTIKVMLCSSSYTPNQDTHDYKDDVTNEVAGGGYPAGGATLSSPTVTYDSGTNRLILDGADVTFTSAPQSRFAVVYDSTPGSDATRPLLCVVDFGQDEYVASITWHADGIAYTTVA